MNELIAHIERLETEGNLERLKGIKDALHFMGKYTIKDKDKTLILDYK